MLVQITNPLQKFVNTFENHEPKVLDSSNTKVYNECKRKYFYRVVLGRNVRMSPNQTALDFGSAYHKFREILFKEGQDQALIAALRTTIAPPQSAYPKFEYLDAARLRQACITALSFAKEQEAAGEFKYEQTEWIFSLEFPDGFFIGGKIDVVLKWKGVPWLLDYKTTSQDKKWFVRQFNPNDQISRYLYAFWLLKGEMPKGLIIEALHTTKTVLPNVYRLFETRTEEALLAWRDNLMEIHKEMEYSRQNLSYPLNTGYQCSFCPFRQICSAEGNVGGQIASLQMNYNKQIWDYSADDSKDVAD